MMLSYVPTILPQPPPERLQVGQLVGNGKVLKNQSSSINRKSDKPATLAFKVKNILTELTETEKVHYIFFNIHIQYSIVKDSNADLTVGNWKSKIDP